MRLTSSGTCEEELGGARSVSDLGLGAWLCTRRGIWEEPLGSRRPPATSDMGKNELGDAEKLDETEEEVDGVASAFGEGARVRERKLQRLRVMPCSSGGHGAAREVAARADGFFDPRSCSIACRLPGRKNLERRCASASGLDVAPLPVTYKATIASAGTSIAKDPSALLSNMFGNTPAGCLVEVNAGERAKA